MKLSQFLKPVIVIGLLTLVLVPLFVSSSLYFPFITGKNFAFRIVAEVVFGLWLILAASNKEYRPRASWLFKSYCALMVVMVLATIFGSDPYRSFWSNFERMEGLIGHLHLFAYFVVLTSVFKVEKLWGWLVHTSLGVNAVVAIYSLLQLADKIKINQSAARVDATFGNATYLAVYELFHIFFLLLLLVRRPKNKIIFARYSLLLLLDVFILFQTETRGTALGLIFGLFVAAVAVAWRERARPMVRKWGIGVGVAIVLIVAIFIGVRDSNFVRSTPTLSRLASISLDEGRVRFMVWKMGWEGFKENPILGWGPENYMLVFNKHYNPQMYNQEQWFDRSHNVVFDWLVTSGLLGLLAYLSLFGLAVYTLWRRSTLSTLENGVLTGLLAGYFVHNIFVFDNLISHLLFFGVLGYIHYIGLSTEKAPAETKARINPNLSLYLAPAVVILVVIGIYKFNIKPIKANQTLIRALQTVAEPQTNLDNFHKVFAYNTFADFESSEQMLTQAVNYFGQENISADLKKTYVESAAAQIESVIARSAPNARYYFFSGTLYGRVGDLDRALVALEEAHRLSPAKQTITFQLANVYYAKGDAVKAFELLKQAYESAPDFTEAGDRLIALAAQTKDYQLVLKLWQEKVDLNPNNTQYRTSLAAAYLATGNRPQAIATLEEAIKLDPSFQKEGEFYIKEIKAGRTP